MQEIMDNQLKQGSSNDGDEFKAIGEGETANQIAVLTAGGMTWTFPRKLESRIVQGIVETNRQ
jgi:hypothetical protein